jgi:acetyl-CoA acetyltransferase
VGVADIASPTGMLGQSDRALQFDMIAAALADAGLTIDDVDGLFVAGFGTPVLELAEALRIQPRYSDGTNVGGSSFEVHVEHAAAAIAAGLCEVAVIVYAQTPRSSKGGAWGRARGFFGPSPMTEWEMPYGMRMPMGPYALAASRHAHEFGTTAEQRAEVSVATRQWAALNPNARYRDPITVDDVLASPIISSPLHRLECCLVTDGAGAVVVTTAERARDLPRPPVYILGTGSCHTHAMISEMPDLTITAGAVSGPLAFERAGITARDVDFVELYDSFTITVLLALEDLGFCKKGEAGSFVEGGTLAPGGALPANTNGGGLSYTHPGMYGIFLLVEATRQLRREAGDRQVPGATIGIAHGTGGVLSSTATVVLGREETL